MFGACAGGDGLCGPRGKEAKKPVAHWADSFVEMRHREEDAAHDGVHASEAWERSKANMLQEDEVGGCPGGLID